MSMPPAAAVAGGRSRAVRLLAPLLMAAVLGAVFALCLVQVWKLEGRWFVVTLIGLALLAVAMMVAGRFSEVAFIALLFSVPLAGFAKWSFLDEDRFSQDVRDAALYTGTLGVGVVDLLLIGLYGAWAFRILALRTEPLPRLERIDIWVGLFLLANVLSQWGAVQPLAIFAFEHQLKYTLLYFYVSRHFRREHLPWFMASIAFALLVESALGILQSVGLVPPGIILDKGGGTELLQQQYQVPGIENIKRSTGSLYDSHALGTYIGMLLPFLLMFLYQPRLALRWRLGCVALVLMGMAALVTTYSRSAWIGTLLSGGVAFLVLLRWREPHVGKSLAVLAVLAVPAAPWLFSKLLARLFDAPIDLLLVRFEQFPIAWSIWRENFLFGAGAGNYMVRMDEMNTDWSLPEPVHNVILFIGAELGLLGVVAYYGLVAVMFSRLWVLGSLRHDPWSRLAMAAFAGTVSYVFDGMSNPLFREPTIYMCFWIHVALAVALARIVQDAPAQARSLAPASGTAHAA
jgi:O-antigen ligase